MAQLIYKDGQFSFLGNVPASIDAEIVDVDLIVYDDVPIGSTLSIINRGCDYINQKYGTSYLAYSGDKSKLNGCVREVNFRMKKTLLSGKSSGRLL